MDEQKITEMFDKEDTYWWFVARRNMVLSLLKQYLKKGDTLLDAGCGTGLLTKSIDRFYNVTATDYSKTSLLLTKKRKPKARIIQTNLEKRLPFKKNEFAGVTLLDVLEHIDDEKALIHIHRVMRPNGILFITVPAYPWLFSYWDILHQHKRRYTAQQLTNILQRKGFVVEHMSYFNTVLFPIILFVRVLKTFFKLHKETTDCYELPRNANSFLAKLFSLETSYATKHRLPFGVSLLAIARKVTV
jgi:2-polyprenyl-3-methyl-5-hydroxy-6-metoxy-1,4-benzoquinol methylase